MISTSTLPKSKEKDIQRAILDYLKYQKVFHWRQNSGNFKTEAGGFYSMGIIGAPDVFILKNGTIFACEVKTKTGKQNPNQLEFQKGFEKHGGRYFVARSVEDVARVLGG